jgi:hypothetical protein
MDVEVNINMYQKELKHSLATQLLFTCFGTKD